ANAVLNNFLLISAFFLDGLANAAQQLCGQAYGARDRTAFSDAVRLVLSWGFGFAVVVALVFALFGPKLIHTMTASGSVQQTAQDYLWFVVASPLLAVFAFGYDGIFIGATWAREMRNLMILSLLAFLATWFALRGLGNTGLWIAMLVLYASRGGLQALRYPVNLRATFGDGLSSLSLSEARVKSPASPRPGSWPHPRQRFPKADRAPCAEASRTDRA